MEASRNQVPLDDVLSSIGLGWFHWRLWWICGLGFSAAAVEVVVMSFVLSELRTYWDLGEYNLGFLVSFVGFGSICGELVFGALADKYGRRYVFNITVIVVVIFGILSAMAPSVIVYAGLRFMVGVGYGGCIAVDFTLYSEFLPTEGRGKMLFILGVFWPLGQVSTCLFAWYLIPSFGWRVFVAVCTVPIFLTALARPLIPESPRWLLLQGQNQEATEICATMATMNGRNPQDVGLGSGCEVCLENECTSLESSHEKKDVGGSIDSLLSGLFNPSLWRTTTGLLIYAVALNYITYGTLTLMPSLLEMKGIAKSSIYEKMLCNSLAQLPGIGVAALAATYVGRLSPMSIFMVIVAVSLLSFSQAKSQGHILVSTMLASGFIEAGWAIYHVYTPEVFPTDVRAFATGFLSAAGSLMAALAPVMSASLLDRGDVSIAIVAFSLIAVLASITTWALLHIETKDRDLHDVSAELGPKK